VSDRRYDLHTSSLYIGTWKRSSLLIMCQLPLENSDMLKYSWEYVVSPIKMNEWISVDADVIDKRQDRQYTNNAILKRVRAVIVAVEKQ
jgi:hypothetical protein